MKRGDIAAIILGIVLVGTCTYLMLAFPHRKQPNWGFGPEWDCKDPGTGEPVCTKKPASN